MNGGLVIMRSMRVVHGLELLLLLLLAGCYDISLFSDYDPSIDRSHYLTYSWSSGGAGQQIGDDEVHNPFFYSRVRTAVDRELAARGYEFKNKGPVDFMVDVHARTLFISDGYFDTYFSFRHPYRGRWMHSDPWWGVRGPESYPRYYEECTLVIDVTDALRHQPAWRGAARGVSREFGSDRAMQEDIDHAVSKIIERFSPLKKAR